MINLYYEVAMLDYRVKTFLTLYKEMNYRKTAELLNMTQPGVTQHIHFLENYYGVKLFQWSGKALRRTSEADRLKMYLEGIVADERVLFRDFLTQDRVQLDVGVTKTIGDYVINSEIIDFIRNTDHNINLIIDNTENLLEKIENAELDFAIIEGVFDKQRYKHRLFKKESFVGVCSVDHRFANKTVSVEEILKETLVLREKGSGTRVLFEQAIEAVGYSVKSFGKCVTISSFSLISDIISHSDAITFAYMPIADYSPKLATFNIYDISVVGEFNFVYSSEKNAEEKISMLFGG